MGKILKYKEFILKEENRSENIEKYSRIHERIHEFIQFMKLKYEEESNIENGLDEIEKKSFPISYIINNYIKDITKEELVDYIKNGKIVSYDISLNNDNTEIQFSNLNAPSEKRYISGRKD
jgi:hypothetical protein